MRKQEEGQGWFAENKRWVYPVILFILGNATGGTAFNIDRIWDYMPSDPSVQVELDEMNVSLDNLNTEIDNLKTSVDDLSSVYAEIINRVEELEKRIVQNKNEIDGVKSDMETLKSSDLPQGVIDDLSLRISKLEEWHKK